MTDHYAEALRVISALPSGDTLDQAYAYAQVHATLALAEQQRIANLVELNHMRLYADETGALHPDIARALRIETT